MSIVITLSSYTHDRMKWSPKYEEKTLFLMLTAHEKQIDIESYFIL